MQQYLTEEQIEQRQDIFFAILEEFIDENYDVDEGYVMTEEEAYIASILMEYFEEKFRFPSLQESAYESMTGYDINTPLYEELYEVLLDESIGSAVAGLRYGIKDYFAKKDYARKYPESEAARAKKKETAAQAKTAERQYKADIKSGAYGTGIKGAFKQAYAGGGVEKALAKAQKAKEVARKKHEAQWNAREKMHGVAKSREQLASKIDTGIENIKNKAKGAITKGASKVGRFLGRTFG